MGIKTKENLIITKEENEVKNENFIEDMKNVEIENMARDRAINNSGISIAENKIQKTSKFNTGFLGTRLYNEDIEASKLICITKNINFKDLMEQWIRRTAKVELTNEQYKSIYGVEKENSNLRLGFIKKNREGK